MNKGFFGAKQETLKYFMDKADPYGLYHRLDSPNPDDDEFEGDTLSGKWIPVNAGGGTTHWTQGNGVLTADFASVAANQCSLLLKPCTLGDNDAFESAISMMFIANGNPGCGICVTDGIATNSKIWATWLYNTSGAPTMGALTTTVNSLSSAFTTVVPVYFLDNPKRIKLFRTDATHFGYKISAAAGKIWTPVPIAGTTYNPGFTPTHAGFWVSDWNDTQKAIAQFNYFRKVSASSTP